MESETKPLTEHEFSQTIGDHYYGHIEATHRGQGLIFIAITSF